MRERLDRVDRTEVERLAGEHLADPADLWLSTSLDALRGEDGEIDATKVEAELTRVTAGAGIGVSTSRTPTFTVAPGKSRRKDRRSDRPSRARCAAGDRPEGLLVFSLRERPERALTATSMRPVREAS